MFFRFAASASADAPRPSFAVILPVSRRTMAQRLLKELHRRCKTAFIDTDD